VQTKLKNENTATDRTRGKQKTRYWKTGGDQSKNVEELTRGRPVRATQGANHWTKMEKSGEGEHSKEKLAAEPRFDGRLKEQIGVTSKTSQATKR